MIPLERQYKPQNELLQSNSSAYFYQADCQDTSKYTIHALEILYIYIWTN